MCFAIEAVTDDLLPSNWQNKMSAERLKKLPRFLLKLLLMKLVRTAVELSIAVRICWETETQVTKSIIVNVVECD